MDQNTYYHEKQSLLLCGLAAVNNILQKQCYTKDQMNAIADSLPKIDNKFFSGYSNFLGLGNFSADVLIQALNKQQKEVIYLDKRKIKELNQIFSDQRIVGLIVNKQEKKWYGTSCHWLAILKDKELWINLDGKNKQYIIYQGINKLYDEFLKIILENGECLIVLNQ